MMTEVEAGRSVARENLRLLVALASLNALVHCVVLYIKSSTIAVFINFAFFFMLLLTSVVLVKIVSTLSWPDYLSWTFLIRRLLDMGLVSVIAGRNLDNLLPTFRCSIIALLTVIFIIQSIRLA